MTDSPEPRRVSYSQYSVWATCPHQWKLKYVDKLKEPSSIHLIFGTAIHEAIQQWLTLRFKDDFKAKIFDMEGVFKDKLLSLFQEEVKKDTDGTPTYLCDKPTLKEFYADGVEILKHVRKHKDQFFPNKGYELIGCEIPLEVMLHKGVQFIGYIDIVTQHKKSGEIFIYDLKTSKKGWFYEKKDPKKLNQLLLYKKFYADNFEVDPRLINVQFVILKRKINEDSEWAQNRVTKFEPADGNISVNKAWASFDQFVTETFNADGSVRIDNLKPTPSEKNCRWCFFRSKPDLCAVSQAKDK